MAQSKVILVSGATGLVGKPLCRALAKRGHQVRTISRSKEADFQWSVKKEKMSAKAMEGVDVVIHLAGESVAQRWDEETRDRIIESRVVSGRMLVNAILQQPNKPAYISASGINYYGLDRNQLLDESAGTGRGFLSQVCQKWEAVAEPLTDAGIRTVFMRTGVVLSKKGGALKKMLPVFQTGAGGRLGSGRQMMSWISLPDLVGAYVHAVENEKVKGPVNAVAPNPVENRVFTKQLGKALGRPTFLPVPGAVIKTLFGDMGKETVLSNLKIAPKNLKETGFVWKHPQLETAFAEIL